MLDQWRSTFVGSKFKEKLFILLVITMAFFFCEGGCGSDDDDGDNNVKETRIYGDQGIDFNTGTNQIYFSYSRLAFLLGTEAGGLPNNQLADTGTYLTEQEALNMSCEEASEDFIFNSNTAKSVFVDHVYFLQTETGDCFTFIVDDLVEGSSADTTYIDIRWIRK